MFVSLNIPIEKHALYNDLRYKKHFNNINYKHYCLVKRDNNCFYYSFIHSLLILVKKMSDPEIQDIKIKMDELKKKILEINKCTLAFDDFYETFFDELDKSRKNEIEEIETEPNVDFGEYASKENQEHYNYLMAFIKCVVSNYLRYNQERFKHYLSEDVETYCRRNVDIFNKDAGEIEIRALSEAIGVGIKVIHIEDGYELHSGNENLFVVMLFTPGHFEPLYK